MSNFMGNTRTDLIELLSDNGYLNKKLQEVMDLQIDTDSIPTGDMPGDKVAIGPDHFKKAKLILPKLVELLGPVLKDNPFQRAVVSVYGGSGVGKSEIASLLSYYLNALGLGSYTLSGDNYPHRIPKYNDAERLRIFRQNGVRGLISKGVYNREIGETLKELQLKGCDADPANIKDHPWMSVYLDAGACGLKDYLGSEKEIDFKELNGIISQFKNGADKIYLKRMGREEHELWYDLVDFGNVNVFIIEWTHGNSYYLRGIDVPVMLNSTPKETLEHRRKRNRDGGVDSPFTTLVLSIEQDLLVSQAKRAKLIVSKSCEILSYEEFLKVMMPDSEQ